MEIWKEYKNSGYYVSDLGNIKNGKTDRILKQYIGTNGYKGIKFPMNKKRRTFSVHRLVAETFIPNVNNKPEVDHKNRNKLDNRVKNLRWVTRLENVRNKFYKIPRKTKHKCPIDRIERIIKLYNNGLNGEEIYKIINA